MKASFPMQRELESLTQKNTLPYLLKHTLYVALKVKNYISVKIRYFGYTKAAKWTSIIPTH